MAREQQGFVNAKGEVSVRHPITGAAFWVPRDKMQAALDDGWELEPLEDYSARVRHQQYEDAGTAFVGGLGRMLTFGATDFLQEAADPGRVGKLKSESPVANFVGEGIGFAAPMAPGIVARIGAKAATRAAGKTAAKAATEVAPPARPTATMALEQPSGAGRLAPTPEPVAAAAQPAAGGRYQYKGWGDRGMERGLQDVRAELEVGARATPRDPAWRAAHEALERGEFRGLQVGASRPAEQREAAQALSRMASGQSAGKVSPRAQASVSQALDDAARADAEIAAIEGLDAAALGKAGRAHPELQQDVPAAMFQALGGPHRGLRAGIEGMPTGPMKNPRWTLDDAGELVIGEAAAEVPAANAAGRARQALAGLPKDAPAAPAASPATAREALRQFVADAVQSGNVARAKAAVEGSLSETRRLSTAARAGLQREARDLRAVAGLGRPPRQMTGPQRVVRVEPGRQVTGPHAPLAETRNVRPGRTGPQLPEAVDVSMDVGSVVDDIGRSLSGAEPRVATAVINESLKATGAASPRAMAAAARAAAQKISVGAAPEAVLAQSAVRKLSEAGQTAVARLAVGAAEGGAIGFTQGVSGASMLRDPAPGELGRQVAEGLFYGALAGGLFTAAGIGLSSVTRKLGSKAKDAVAAERLEDMRKLRADLEADVAAASKHPGLHKALSEHEVAAARRRALGSNMEAEAALEDAVKKVAREAEAAGFPMGRGPQSHVPVHQIPAAMEGVQREMRRAGSESFGLGGMGNWIAQSAGAAAGAKIGGGFGAIIGSTALPWAARKLSGLMAAGKSGMRQVARTLGVLSPAVKFAAIRELTVAEYKELRKEAARLNPADTRAAAMEAYHGEGLDQDTAKMLADFQGRRTAALVEEIKRAQSPEELRRSLNALLNPLSIIKSLSDGWLSECERRVLERVAPGMYRQLAEAATLALEDDKVKWKMTTEWRSTLQRIAGDPIYAQGVIGMALAEAEEDQQKQDAARQIRGRVGMPTIKREGLELDRMASGSPGG